MQDSTVVVAAVVYVTKVASDAKDKEKMCLFCVHKIKIPKRYRILIK